MRAIDMHVHLPTPEWLDQSMAGYVEAAEEYFRSPVRRRTIDQVAREYEERDILAVLLAWDAETATGRPRLPNKGGAEAVRAATNEVARFEPGAAPRRERVVRAAQ